MLLTIFESEIIQFSKLKNIKKNLEQKNYDKQIINLYNAFFLSKLSCFIIKFFFFIYHKFRA